MNIFVDSLLIILQNNDVISHRILVTILVKKINCRCYKETLEVFDFHINYGVLLVSHGRMHMNVVWYQEIWHDLLSKSS